MIILIGGSLCRSGFVAVAHGDGDRDQAALPLEQERACGLD
jgi:hypothetical protein